MTEDKFFDNIWNSMLTRRFDEPDLFKWTDGLFDPSNIPWRSEWLTRLFRNSPFKREDTNE